jgi:hypothetical protein
MTFAEIIHNEFIRAMILVLMSFSFLLSFVLAFSNEKSEIKSEKKVAEFAQRYKEGDNFWAIHKTINLDDFAKKNALTSKIFHITVRKVCKKYFEITDEFRPNWKQRRIAMTDFIIFKNKAEITSYIKAVQDILKERIGKR